MCPIDRWLSGSMEGGSRNARRLNEFWPFQRLIGPSVAVQVPALIWLWSMAAAVIDCMVNVLWLFL